MRLDGQTAIITGGASGLGAATAARLAAAGCRVAVLDINQAAAEARGKELGGMGLACDVAVAASAEAAVVAVQQRFGPPRILVNCAGVGTAGRIVGRDGPLRLDAFERVIRINLIGSFNLLRLCAAAMVETEALEDGERGVIVNTASIAAYEGQVGQAAYAASKGGVVGMTLPAARELAKFGVRVVTIAPGLFHTPMVEGLPPETQASLGAGIPFPPRLGRPDEYAALVEHIATNRFLNGEVIRLDGALRMPPR
ncbi:MAG: SDR family NAD(P)-dependent oxidoreductase [Rhodospirillales bacterium]|nr:SDR family NAD(P)-dependent oxidoreductase [Rhodospirillales bacterium]MBN8897927.1 SDR family NAD(P)-dependent oxidoreductase [Rhodospirillales bacterium]